MVIISHPTGNQNARAAAIGFAEAGIARSFNTTIASFQGDLLDRLSDFKPLAELRRRRFDARIKHITETWPWLELCRLASSKAGLRNFIKHEHGTFCVDAVYRNLDKRIASTLKVRSGQGVAGVYAYEDGALFSFMEAKKLGLKCLYDLPIGYWRAARKMLEAEKEHWPDWAPTLTSFYDSGDKLERKDHEIAMADGIFVASQFTATTLADFNGPTAPVHVIPYGFPPVANGREYEMNYGRPLKVLFIGGLSQRKGIAYLFSAVQSLNRHVELTVVGQKPSNNCAPLNRALAKHRWFPTLPHHEVLSLMRSQDVLVFPSLFEGFGLVITEAMSQGTPVITTERTAGPDVIASGENGWIIKAGSTESLVQALEIAISNRLHLRDAGMAAMETARHRPWERYGHELAKAVTDACMADKRKRTTHHG